MQRDEVPYSLQFVYVWLDSRNAFHLLPLHDTATGATPCRCGETLRLLTDSSSVSFFLFILMHKRKTYFLYLATRLDMGSAERLFEPQNLLTTSVSLHYGHCRPENCQCGLHTTHQTDVLVEQSPFSTARVKMIRYANLLHQSNCNASVYCCCSKNLIEGGYYKIRGETKVERLMCGTGLLHNVLVWSRVKPYENHLLEKTMGMCARFDYLHIEDGYVPMEHENRVHDREAPILSDSSAATTAPEEEGASANFLSPFKIETSHVQDALECTVCLQAFELDAEAIRLLCGHMFHRMCIGKWLESHATCPMCRAEVPSVGTTPRASTLEEIWPALTHILQMHQSPLLSILPPGPRWSQGYQFYIFHPTPR